MIPCPGCKRRVFSGREMLAANLDGRAKCPACGQLARLDSMSRCLLACMLALLLWMLLLHGNIFDSGYLFLFSTIVIVSGWRLLCAAALPLLTLEKAPSGASFNRRQSIVTLAILIMTSVVMDGLMSYRSDADRALGDVAPPSVSASSQ
jgi:hypothetical protein